MVEKFIILYDPDKSLYTSCSHSYASNFSDTEGECIHYDADESTLLKIWGIRRTDKERLESSLHIIRKEDAAKARIDKLSTSFKA